MVAEGSSKANPLRPDPEEWVGGGKIRDKMESVSGRGNTVQHLELQRKQLTFHSGKDCEKASVGQYYRRTSTFKRGQRGENVKQARGMYCGIDFFLSLRS
jgi:hypothetical protein